MFNLKRIIVLILLGLLLFGSGVACRPAAGEPEPEIVLSKATATVRIVVPEETKPAVTTVAPMPTEITVTPSAEPASVNEDEGEYSSSPLPTEKAADVTPVPSRPTDSTHVKALTGVNIRSGPTLDATVLDWLVEGQVTQVTGTSLNDAWWEIPCGAWPTGRCWITALPDFVEPVPAPNPGAAQRIFFTPGSSSATVPGSVAPQQPSRYILRGAAGQQMIVRVKDISNHALVTVLGVEDQIVYIGKHDAGSPARFDLPTNQDYLVIVEDDGRPASFVMDVAIINPAIDPEPVRVIFAPGMNSASLNRHVSPFFYGGFLVGAAAGQTLRVEVTSDTGAANFSLTGAADGQPFKRLVNEDRTWSIVVPETQDYVLKVAVPADFTGTQYVLTVSLMDPGITPTPEVPWIMQSELEPPAGLCVAYNPGDLPVPVRAEPKVEGTLIARLGNWSEIVHSRLDWHEIRTFDDETGWVQFDHILVGGPCRSDGPLNMVVTIDSTGELPAEVCAAHRPDGADPVAVRSEPQAEATLLAVLVTWTAVTEVNGDWAALEIGHEKQGWTLLEQVSLSAGCLI